MKASIITIISSYSIMAFALYAGESNAALWPQVSLKEKVDKKTEVPLLLKTDPLQVIGFSDKAQALVLENKNSNNLYYQVVEAGFDTQPPASKMTKGVEVYKEYKDKNGNMVKKVTLGDEINVHLKFRGLSEERTIWSLSTSCLLVLIGVLCTGWRELDSREHRQARRTYHPLRSYTKVIR